MIYTVLDIEADELIAKVTKIHCLSYRTYENETLITSGALTSYKDISKFVLAQEIIVGHNIIKYDIPVLEKILNIKVTAILVDTLGLSQYLYPNKLKHGLEDWGEFFGITKPAITNWNDLSVSEYIHRCDEDVKINTKLWQMQYPYLLKIYDGNRDAAMRLIRYLGFKLDCIREQEDQKWKLDIETCKSNLDKLEIISEEKKNVLIDVMPKHNLYSIHKRPKVMYRKDGTESELAKKWFERLKAHDLPYHHLGDVKEISKVEDGNPTSFPQVKEWLYSLGWIPITFSYVREKKNPYDNPARKIPQISNDDRSDLCESVKALYEKEPKLVEFETFFKVRHRIGILNAFLEHVDKDGFLVAEINGFTNTLRMQHKKPIVNLPGIPKLHWKMIRGCLIARDEDHILCGADMSGLEDNTGRHYMHYYDPKYVEELNAPGYDAHLDMAVRGKLLTEEQADMYKVLDNKEHLDETEYSTYSVLKPIRLRAKKGNFAAKYGAGGPKIAVTMGISDNEGTQFHSAYWVRNRSIKQVAANTIHKTVNGQMWLYNPVSQFWYSLRYVKDKFSTLNQGTGVYCFDMWTKYCREQGYKLCMQYHDEHVGDILKTDREKTEIILNKAIDKVNETLKLNIKLGVKIVFGNSYADIH